MLSISDNPVSATACGLHLHLELPCLKMYIHKLALAEHDPQKAKVCVCVCVCTHSGCMRAVVLLVWEKMGVCGQKQRVRRV